MVSMSRGTNLLKETELEIRSTYICCTFTYIYTRTDYTLPTITELERDTRLLQGVTYLWKYIYNTNKHIRGLRLLVPNIHGFPHQ
jgi:hypothetical protein